MAEFLFSMAEFLFSRDPPAVRVVRSGFGDGSTVGLERDVVELRAAAHAGVERVQGFELGGGELEVEHVEVLCDPFGPYRLRDPERPSCRCQRIITCAGVLRWAAAIALMAGSSKVAVPVPR
jgi:hypothetical protein